MYWIGKWWQRRKVLLYGDLMDGFWSPLLPLYEQLDKHMHCYYHIFLIDLFVN